MNPTTHKRGRPAGKTKIKVLITLDKSIYQKARAKGYNLSGLLNRLLSLYFANGEEISFSSARLVSGRSRVQIPPGALNRKSFETDFLNKRNISEKWRKSLVGSLKSSLSKSIYQNSDELKEDIKLHLVGINSRKDRAKAVKQFIRYAKMQGFLSTREWEELNQLIKVKKGKPDLYIPSREEILHSISQLKGDYLIFYKMLLFSGLRVSEGVYLINNRGNLKVQKKKGYIKILLNWKRGQKSAYFAFLPYPLSRKLLNSFKVSGLQTYIKRHNLIPLKYLRKYFYSKGLEAGIPSEVLDFIQGRTPKTIGSMHYVRLELLADKFISKIWKALKIPLAENT